MNYKFLIPFIAFGPLCFSQYQFELKNASKNYDVKINVEHCDKDECSGKGTVELLTKSLMKIQTFTSDNLNFYLQEDQKPTSNVIQLYNEQSPVILEDFNFDGTEDIAIRNGNQSSYGGPSYEVYVFNATQKKFVLSEELTNLAHENLGMFHTDSERKRLIAYSKSGCCWHLTTEYAVIPQKGIIKVYEVEEDATGGEQVKVITREFKDDKWIENIKQYPISEYYKE